MEHYSIKIRPDIMTDDLFGLLYRSFNYFVIQELIS